MASQGHAHFELRTSFIGDSVEASWRGVNDPTGVAPAPPAFRHFANDVYFVEPAAAVARLPRLARHAGRVFQRFMDFIYVPAPLELLTRSQVISVNQLREHLVPVAGMLDTNATVKRKVAAALRSLPVRHVLEWGCGYDSLIPFLPPDVGYAATDVDPDVVRHQRERGVTCYLADEVLHHLPRSWFDVVVSVFVFQFDVPPVHLVAMRDLLRPGGLVVANVYRRSDRSRAQLRTGLESCGLLLQVRADAEALCRRHEYWVGYTHGGQEHVGRLLRKL